MTSFHHYLATLSYMSPEEREKSLREKGHHHLKIHQNKENYAGIYDQSTNKYYHLHRGTSNWEDVQTDFGLATGNLQGTSRYRDTEQNVNAGYNEYYGAEHTHVGHSLGGTLADSFAREHDDASVAFNMGTSPFAQKRTFTDKNQHVRIQGDAVSGFNSDDGSTTMQGAASPMQQQLNQSREQLPDYLPAEWGTFGVGTFGPAESFFAHGLDNFTNVLNDLF